MEQSGGLCCWREPPTAGNPGAGASSVHKAQRGSRRMAWALGANKEAGWQGVVTRAGWLDSKDNLDKISVFTIGIIREEI